MATSRTITASPDLQALFNVGSMAGLTDSQLLDRFLHKNGEAAELAFSALVERHGRIVYQVCRSILLDSNDAHDAFQATFLVLVRRGRHIRNRESLSSWLHGVALRVATSARAASLERAVRERQTARPEATDSLREALETNEIRVVVHEEVDRLPERFREPITLCDLEERTHEEAAAQLGWPVGTVKSRLSRGRDRLRSRLIRRGFTPTVALGYGTVIGTDGTASAFAWSFVSRELVLPTATAAIEFATGRAGPGLFRASSAYLAKGVLNIMIVQAWMRRFVLFGVLGLGTLTVGWSVIGSPAAPQEPGKKVDPSPITTSTPVVSDTEIEYDIRFFDAPSIKWRENAEPLLDLKQQFDSQTVWTVDSVKDLTEIYRIIFALWPDNPKAKEGYVESYSGLKTDKNGMATYDKEKEVEISGGFNKKRERGKIVLISPIMRKVKYGNHCEVSGVLQPDGVLINAKIDQRRLLNIRTSAVALPSVDRSSVVQGKVDIPEMIHSEVSGNWLVPRHGALLVSLGIHRRGVFYPFNLRETVFERLAVIVPRVPKDGNTDRIFVDPKQVRFENR